MRLKDVTSWAQQCLSWWFFSSSSLVCVVVRYTFRNRFSWHLRMFDTIRYFRHMRRICNIQKKTILIFQTTFFHTSKFHILIMLSIFSLFWAYLLNFWYITNIYDMSVNFVHMFQTCWQLFVLQTTIHTFSLFLAVFDIWYLVGISI